MAVTKKATAKTSKRTSKTSTKKGIEPVALSYFYGQESYAYSFLRVPKALFTLEQYRAISADAKLLYGLFLDRMSLSAKSNWFDKDGRVYIIYTVEELREVLDYANQKIIRLMDELEDHALIERVRQGRGLPNIIYVKNFIPPQNNNDNA